MNSPISRGTAALLLLGAVAIFLLGAFTRIGPKPEPPAPPMAVVSEPQPEPAAEPGVPANLSPGLGEIVKLAQNHVDENVIVAYIQNSGLKYSVTADEILYLTDLGLSQNVITALLKKPLPASSPPAPAVATEIAEAKPAPSELPAPANAPVAAQNPNPDNFYDALSPYGKWIDVPHRGLCWQPGTVLDDPDWRPYVDQGQWLYTENGWYWQSGYSWGAIAFHYGRWTKSGRFGWVWLPDNVWGPAWVSWRLAPNYAGWAPLPPGVGLDTGFGLTFNNRRVAKDFDFGLRPRWYTFVNEQSLTDPNLAQYESSDMNPFFNRSVPVNNYSMVNHKIFNRGPGRIGSISEIPKVPIMPTTPPRYVLEKESPRVAALPGVPRTELAEIAVPRQNTLVPVTTSTLPQPQRIRSPEWPEARMAYPNEAVPARWESSVVKHEASPAPVEREAPRLTEAAVPTPALSTKTGK